MYRRFIFFIVALTASNVAIAQTSTQNWECALDLHQGDNGTLSLQRVDDKVNGEINILRNDSSFTSSIEGLWVENEISIKRLLNATSSEAMSGIVVSTGTEQVKMGGRYSAAYQGVWSADCDLVSNSTTSAQDEQKAVASTEPSTSSRVTPSSPTNTDRLKFSALASHPDGIKSVSFILGDKKIHTCEASQCDFSYGPLSQGNYSWRVEAVSQSDVKNSEQFNKLVVASSDTKGNCTISGVATGTAAALSTIYIVNLYGPDNLDRFKSSTSFENNSYQFTNLPNGVYILRMDTRGDKGVLTTPSSTTVKCQGQKNITQDFDFR